MLFLEAQHSQSLTTPRLALAIISRLFMGRIGRSLRFCHQAFGKEGIYNVMVAKVKMPSIGGGLNFS